MYRLKSAGYDAYLVGGGVRDMMLGREPKDIDIATTALPDAVKKIFRNCMLIGRRFRLAHARFENEIVEVATFRAPGEGGAGDDKAHTETGRILRDNVYGTIEEDALRRDFTVSALYYTIQDFYVNDIVDSMRELQAGVLRLCVDPELGDREDPVRRLRAGRFAAMLCVRIDGDSEAALVAMGHL